MRVRYNGPDARVLSFPGGGIVCEPRKWVDVEKAAAEAHIPEHHLEVALLGLADQPDWDVELDTKTKGRKATDTATAPSTPAEPDEEQS